MAPPEGPQFGLGSMGGGVDLAAHQTAKDIQRATHMAAHYLLAVTRAREHPQIYEIEEYEYQNMIRLLKDYMSYTCQSAGACFHGMSTHDALYHALRELAAVLLPLIQCREGSSTWVGLDTIWRFYIARGSMPRQWGATGAGASSWAPPTTASGRHGASIFRTEAPPAPRTLPPVRYPTSGNPTGAIARPGRRGDTPPSSPSSASGRVATPGPACLPRQCLA